MPSTCIPFTTIAGAGQHSFNTCLRCTWYRGCRPTHQIPVQCWASVAAHCWFNSTYDAGPTLIYHRSCCILWANTWHSSNAVSMLPHGLQRWPFIETALDYVSCFLTAAACWWLLTSRRQKKTDNTIDWCNAGPTLFQPKPFKLLTTNIMVNKYFSEHLLKKKST